MIRLSQAQEHPLCSQGGTRVLWSATATTSLEISSILASNSSLFLRCEISRARCTTRWRLRRGSSNTRVETFTHILSPERVLTSRSNSGVSNFCAAHCWTLQSPIQPCVLRRDRLELHSTPGSARPPRSIQTVAPQPGSTGYRKCGVRRPLQECEQFRLQHPGLPASALRASIPLCVLRWSFPLVLLVDLRKLAPLGGQVIECKDRGDRTNGHARATIDPLLWIDV
jgi:hypothetical protein